MIKVVKLTRKSLLIYFSVLLAMGIVIRVLISPVLWPAVPEVSDPVRITLSLIMVLLGLGSVYYLKVHGTPKDIRLFYTITIGLALGFGIFAATASLYIMLLGQPLPDFLFIPTYIVAYIIAFYVGNMVGRRRE